MNLWEEVEAKPGKEKKKEKNNEQRLKKEKLKPPGRLHLATV